jgi:hypothetical protein
MKRGFLVGAVSLVLVRAVVGCPIAPDFSSPDAGPMDSGVVDSGMIDAGATGSIGATLQPSNVTNSESLAWNGTDVSASTLDSATQVTLRGTNAASGTFELQLQNLQACGVTALWSLVSYSPTSGEDSWSCSNNLDTGCTVDVTLSGFNGTTISGVFAVAFPVDSNLDSATLQSGTFSVTFP